MIRGTDLGAALVALSIISSYSQATLIDFEPSDSVPRLASPTWPGATIIGDNYEISDGVSFERHWHFDRRGKPEEQNLWRLLSSTGYGMSAHSGNQFLFFSSSFNSHSISISFTEAIDMFSTYVGSLAGASWTYEVYFESEQVLSNTITSLAGEYSEISFENLRADRVNIISSARMGVMDDLSFRAASNAPVPVSSTLSLLLAGLLLPIGLRCRALKRQSKAFD